MLVWPPAGQPRAASADTEPSTREPAPAKETAPAAQAASHTAPPPEGAPGTHGVETAAPASRAAAPTAAPARCQRGGGGGRRRPQARRRGPPRPQRRAGRVHKELKPRPLKPLHRRGRPRRGPWHTADAGDRPRADLGRLAGTRPSRSGSQGEREVPRQHQPKPHPHQPPQAVPPQGRPPHGADAASQPPGAGAFAAGRHAASAAAATGRPARGPGGGERRTGRAGCRPRERGAGDREATGGVPRDTHRGRASVHTARSKGEGAGMVPRPAAAEGGRARAADSTMRGKEQGKDRSTGRTRRGASRAPRRAATKRMEWNGARSASVGTAEGMDTGTGRVRAPAVQARAQVTGGGDPRRGQGDKGVGAGKGPKGNGKSAVGPQGQTGRGAGAKGGGRSERRGTGSEAPPQPDVQPVRCIPPRHPTNHHHHHHAHLYNIDPDAGVLIPPEPARPQHQPPPPRRQGGGARRRCRRQRGHRGSRRGGQGGPGPGTGTGARSGTPLGMRRPPWWWKCTGG